MARRILATVLSRVKVLMEAYLLRSQIPGHKVENGLLLTSKPMLDKLNKPLGNLDLRIPVRCFPNQAIPFKLTCLVPFKNSAPLTKTAKARAPDFSEIKGTVVRLYHSTRAPLTKGSPFPEETNVIGNLGKVEDLDEVQRFKKALPEWMRQNLKAKPPEKDPGIDEGPTQK